MRHANKGYCMKQVSDGILGDHVYCDHCQSD